jgi:hypothetical protein
MFLPTPADGLPGNNNSLYVRHITSPDAFPCAVVEEEDIVAIDAGDNEQYWKIYGLNCLVFTELAARAQGKTQRNPNPLMK